MRQKKQLNLRLDPATCDLIDELAEGKHINAFMEELVQQEVARRKGELIEGRLLPLLREMIQQEFHRVIAQLHTDLQEDLSRMTQWHADHIVGEAKYRERQNTDRLAALTIRAIREGGISRRMLFTYLAKEDHQFAMEVYEDAIAKVGKDLAKRLDEPQVS